ncbi:hypothetical protein ACFQ0T_08695 [Kitasatospora gansuensis]
MYYSPTGWATTTNFTQRSVKAGNSEALTINRPPTGYVYLSLFAAASFDKVSITTQF